MPCSVPVNCPAVICLPFMPCCLYKESTSSELWTPVQYLPLIHLPLLHVYMLQTIITFCTIQLILCYSKPVSLTTSLFLGAKSWVCVVQVSTLLATPVWRFLPPTGPITSVSYWGKTCCCDASHLSLGVPNRLHINWAINKFSGAVAGEAKDVFTRGVLINLSLYFVFSLLSFFCLVLFASF